MHYCSLKITSPSISKKKEEHEKRRKRIQHKSADAHEHEQ
jgi:hypothetical protein